MSVKTARLSTDCADHLADVRHRRRQERRVPCAVETLSPRRGRNRALAVVVHWTHGRQPLERGPLSVRIHRAPELLGARGHGPVHASPRRCRRAPGVTAADVCRMFNVAIQGQGAPRHLSTDHDPLFEAYRWRANLRILEIDELKTVPQVPLSHPFVERLIGTMRREFLDHVPFWNARDLERKLAEFRARRCAVGLPLSGPRPAPSRCVMTNSRPTGLCQPPAYFKAPTAHYMGQPITSGHLITS